VKASQIVQVAREGVQRLDEGLGEHGLVPLGRRVGGRDDDAVAAGKALEKREARAGRVHERQAARDVLQQLLEIGGAQVRAYEVVLGVDPVERAVADQSDQQLIGGIHFGPEGGHGLLQVIPGCESHARSGLVSEDGDVLLVEPELVAEGEDERGSPPVVVLGVGRPARGARDDQRVSIFRAGARRRRSRDGQDQRRHPQDSKARDSMHRPARAAI
jgi:hypothetical protein